MLATSVAMARLVPPAAQGKAVVVLIIPLLATVITYEGIGAPLIQRRELDDSMTRTGMTLSILLGLVLSILVFVLARPVANPIFGDDIAELFRLAAPVGVVAGLGAVSRALLQRRLDFVGLNLAEVGATLTTSAVMLTLAVAGYDATAIVVGAVAGVAASTAVVVARARFVRPGWRFDDVRAISAFGSPAAISGLAYSLNRNIDYVVLGARLNPAALGLYWRAFQLGVEYPSKVTGISTRVARPLLLRAKDRAQLQSMRRRVVRANATLLFPLLCTLIVIAPDVIPFLYGDRWSGAARPAQVLAVAGMANTVIAGIEAPLLTVGRPGVLAVFSTFLLVAVAVAAFVSATHGLVAVSIAMAATFVAALAVAQWMLRRYVGVPLRAVAEDVGAASVGGAVMLAGMVLVARSLQDAGAAARVGAVVVVGFVLYGMTLRLAFRSALEDITLLIGRDLPFRRRPAAL